MLLVKFSRSCDQFANIKYLICLLILLCFLIMPQTSVAESQYANFSKIDMTLAIRGMNGIYLDNNVNKTNFSFLVMGHIYGSHDLRSPVWNPSYSGPAVTLLHELDRLSKLNADFIISLGDIVATVDNEETYMLENLFLKKFSIPVFNATGNHDSPLELYKKNYGETSFYFKYGNCMFIFLGYGRIPLDLFMEAVNLSKTDDEIKNIFVCKHTPEFLAISPKFIPIMKHANAGFVYNDQTEFMLNCYPELEKISHEKGVYLLSGDIGANWSYSIFYHKEGNMHYIATGLGDTENDAILKFDCTEAGVRISPISLIQGKEMHNIEYYGIDFWRMYFSFFR
ncbi:MAG: metallophosphoesterase family protein [Candidatus Omnitrophota bacterium]